MDYQYVIILFKAIGFFAYLLQVLLYTALLLLTYFLLLRNRVTHSFNRCFLLLCAVFPFLLPWVKLPALMHAVPIPSGIAAVMLPDGAVSINSVPDTLSKEHFYFTVIAIVPFIALLLLVRMFRQYYRLKRTLQRKPYELLGDIKIFRSTGMGPGSWQKHIFFPGAETDPAILRHEQAHVQLGHSYDLMLLQILQCIFWPNVLLYFITRELRMVHEFQADEAAAAATDKNTYAVTMLNETFHTTQFSLSHPFFQHPLKRRIAMLQKTTTNRRRLITILSAVLITSCFIGPIVLAQNAKKDKPGTITTDAIIDKYTALRTTGVTAVPLKTSDIPEKQRKEAEDRLAQYNKEYHTGAAGTNEKNGPTMQVITDSIKHGKP